MSFHQPPSVCQSFLQQWVKIPFESSRFFNFSRTYIMIPLLSCFTHMHDHSHFTLLTTKSCRNNTNNIKMLRDSHCGSCQLEDKRIIGRKNQRASPLVRGLALLVDSLLKGRRGISSWLTSVSRSRDRPTRLRATAMMQAQERSL